MTAAQSGAGAPGGAIHLADFGWAYAGAHEPALEGVSLDIAPGETVVLCGGSGSGKSTLLRAMNGLLAHLADGTSTGVVRFDGLDVAATPLHELGPRMGLVLQHPRRQFFTDTIAQELAFASENFGAAPPLIRARVANATDDAGLNALPPRLHALSGGQQQRVALAAAATHAPRVLFLDEPTANLSAEAIERLRGQLRRHQRAGTTIVLAEHRLHYLRDLAHRVVLLRGGRIRVTWRSAEFRALDNSRLAAEGLRPTHPTTPREAPAVVARGASVAARREPGGPGRGAAATVDPATGLTLLGLRCERGGAPVLALDEAVLPAGQVTAVLGPNGAGKSTLARVIAGLQRHSGRVLLDGAPLTRRARRRATGFVMQDVQRQLFTASLREEVALGSGVAPDGAEVGRLLEEFGLTGLGGRHPLSLSGGEQQRAVIAAAQLSGRRVMIFDEPSSGVDRRHLHAIAAAIRARAAAGAVVLLITHDEALQDLAADRHLSLVPLSR